MIDNEKVKIMTNLAIFEKGSGKEDIKKSRYYKTDYIRLNVLKTLLNVTFSYILIILAICMYNMEYIINNIININFEKIGMIILTAYIIIITFYVLISIIICSISFENSKKRLLKYNKDLDKLKEFYKNET